jgi:hypothetical protein
MIEEIRAPRRPELEGENGVRGTVLNAQSAVNLS